MGRLTDSQGRLGKVMLKRVGVEGDITRPDGTATENRYGKIEDGDRTWADVATERVYPTYGGDNDLPSEARTTGGRINRESPTLAFATDTAAQEDDRVTMSDTGRTYVLIEKIPHELYTAYRANLVNDADN